MITACDCFIRKCVHYLGVKQEDGTELTEEHYCQAFPDGIPEDILDGSDLHSIVRADQDNNIVFEVMEG